jgi:hypothetical protein
MCLPKCHACTRWFPIFFKHLVAFQFTPAQDVLSVLDMFVETKRWPSAGSVWGGALWFMRNSRFRDDAKHGCHALQNLVFGGIAADWRFATAMTVIIASNLCFCV